MLERFRTRPYAPARVKAPLLGLFVVLAVLTTVAIAALGPRVQALTPDSDLNFQARLFTAGGAVVPDGNYNMEFKIYNADSTTGSQGSCTGSCLWMATLTSGNVVKVVNGYFSVNLGAVNTVGTLGAINWDQQMYLTMRIGGTGTPSWDPEMQNSGHSIPLTAVPLAFRANQLAVAGTNEQILQFASSTFGQTTTISLPDPGTTTANVCYQGATACGFATSTGSGSYIQNSAGGPQSANFNIQSASSSSIGGLITGASGQSVDIFDVKANGVSTPLLGVTSTGLITLQPAASLTSGQTAFAQTLTNASSSGGSVNGHSETITVSNTGSATTTYGLNLSITDNASSIANQNTGITIGFGGTNTSQKQTAINISSTIASGGFGLQFGQGVGNGTSGGTGISFGSAGISNGGTGIATGSVLGGSTGVSIGAGSSGGAVLTGTLLNLSQPQTVTSGTQTSSGVFLNVNRAFTNTSGNTLTVSGDLADLASNCTATSGACTDSGKILSLTQSYTSATGTVLNVQGAGTGNVGVLNTTNASANGVSINVQSSSSSQYALDVTSNNAGTQVLYARADGNVGIGTSAPGYQLQVGTGTITPGGYGGGSASIHEFIGNNGESGKYTQLALQGSAGAAIEIYNSSGAAAADFGWNGTDLQFINRASGGAVSFFTNSTQRITVDQNGDVGIGNGAPSGTRLVVSNQSSGDALLALQSNATNVLTVGATGLITVQPAASLTSGQTEVSQTFTNGSTSGGTVQGISQAITISNTTSASTTNGINISIGDSTALGNTNTGVKIVLNGSNSGQLQVGADVSVNRGIGVRAVSSGAGGSYTCGNLTSTVGIAICGADTGGSNVGLGIYGNSVSRSTTGVSDYVGTGVYGVNSAGGTAGAFYGGVKGVALQTAAAAYTATGIYGSANGGAGATIYGGYFTLGTSGATAGAALYASNSTAAENILDLQNNTTDVFVVGNGGLITIAPAASLTSGQNNITQSFTNASTTGGTVQGLSQAITISDTTSASTTNGISIGLTDSTAGSLGNINKGINVSLTGTNAQQIELGADLSVNRGFAIRAVSSGNPGTNVTCANETSQLSIAICADNSTSSFGNTGTGLYARSNSDSASLNGAAGSAVYGVNTATINEAGRTYTGVKGIANPTGANAYTTIGVYGESGVSTASSAATAYGGYFTLTAGSTQTAGSALYASNGSVADNILDLQNNTTDVMVVANNGVTTFTPQTSSATAFLVQNSSSKHLLAVDTSGSQIVLGNQGTSGINGQLVFNTTNASNTAITISAASTATSYSLTLPTTGPSTSQCLQSGAVTASLLTFGSCGGGTTPTLQQVYDASTSQPQIVLDGSPGANGIIIRDNSTPVGSLLTLQNNAHTVNYLDVNATTITTADNLTFSGATPVISANTTNAGLTLQANGTGTLLLDSGTNGAVTVGSAALTVNVCITAACDNINIGTGGDADTIAIGDTTDTTTVAGNSVAVNCGTSTCTFGNNATDHSTTVGSTTGTSLTTITGGTGGVTLGDNTTVASGKNFTANGAATFSDSTNSGTAFQVQNAVGAAVLLVDTTSTDDAGNQLNYLTYSGFEVGTPGSLPTGWANVSPGTNIINNNKAHTYNGLYSDQLTTTASNGGISTTSFVSSPATNVYIISFYAKVTSGANMTGANFTVQTTDGTTHTCNPSASITLGTAVVGFQRLSCSITTTGAITALQITQNNGVAHTIYIDSVQLQTNDYDGGTNNITAPTAYQFGQIQLRGAITNPLVIANNGDSTAAFQVQATSGNTIFGVDTLNAQTVLGTAGSLNGKLAFGTAGGGTLTINPTSSASSFTITLPAETGTVCTTAATGACSTAGGYVQLQSSTPGTAQTGNFNINGTGILGTALTFSGANPVISASTAGTGVTLQAPTTGILTLNTVGAGQVLLGTTNSTVVTAGNTGSVTTIEGSSATAGIAIGNSANAHGIQIGTSGSAIQTITVGSTFSTSTLNLQAGTGNINLNVPAGGGVRLAATAVPTVDQFNITNAGFAPTAAGINNLSLNYTGGAAAVEGASERIDLTPGGTTGGTWDGLRFVAAATGPATGVTETGVKIEAPTSSYVGTFNGLNFIAPTTGPGSGAFLNGVNISSITTPGAGTETGINIGTGWDAGFNVQSAGNVIKVASATAFIVQNATNPVLTVDTSGNQIVLGKSATLGGALLFNTAGAGAITINTASTGTGYTLTLPTTGPSTSQCLESGASTAALLTFVTCGSGGVTTVGAFSASSQTNGASISGSTITFGPADGTNPGEVSTGTQTFAGNKTLTGNTTLTGTVLAENTSNSNNAFLVQNASAVNVLQVDTLGNSASAPASPSVTNLSSTLGTPGLTGAGTYYYKISAIVNGDETALSTETSIVAQTSFTKVATPAAPTYTPSTTGGTLSSGTYRYKLTYTTPNGETTGGTESTVTTTTATSSVAISGTVVTACPTGATGYNVYRTQVGGATNTERFTTSGTCGSGVTDTNPDTGTGGISGNTQVSTITTNTATTNLNEVTVSWSAVAGASGYQIYRGLASGKETAFFTSATTSFIDQGATGTYSYQPITYSSQVQITAAVTTITPVTDSSRALDIQNAAGGNILTVDSTNNRIDIGTGGVSTGQLYVSGVTPASGTAVGTATGFGLIDAVKFQGNFMYATDWINNNLDVFDVSSPANLSTSQISTTSLNGVCNSLGRGVNDLFVAGRYAYMDCQGSPNNFLIYDISNPFAPSRIGTLSLGTDSFPDGVYVQGRYAYVNGGGGAGTYLGIIDISNPAKPVMVNNTSITTSNSGQSIIVQGKYLYENTSASTLQIYDISNPLSPTLIGTSATFTGGTTCNGDFSPDNIAVQGIYVYVAECGANGFQVFNVSNPASISGGTFISTGAGSEPFELVAQDRALYVESNQTGVMQMYDISTPTSAFPVGSPMFVGIGSEAIGVNGRYLYGGDTSLYAYDIGGAYIQQLETGGIQTNGLNVTGLASFGSNITAAGSVSVGQGLQVTGGVGINTSASGGTSALNVNDSVTGVSLLNVQDLSQNFGSLVTGGALVSRNSYWGEEFNRFQSNNCSQTTTAQDPATRGDLGTSPATCANTGGEISASNVLGVAASGNTCLEASQNVINGTERISATSTATATNSASCLEYIAQGTTSGTSDKLFAANNLPVIEMKLTPSTYAAATNAVMVAGLGASGATTVATKGMPTDGVFFSNCTTYSTTAPTCPTSSPVWVGWVVSGSVAIGSVTCTSGAETGNIVQGKTSYLRIEVRANNNIHFFVDSDTSTGITETECGTGVTGTGPGSTGLTMWLQSTVNSNTATAVAMDVDYFRVWQDENVDSPPADDNSDPTSNDTTTSTAPLTVDAATSDTSDQDSFFDFTAATSEDTVFNNDVYVHGTLYADKIEANQIEGLSVFTDQLSSLQQQLTAVKAASTSESSGSSSDDSSSSSETDDSGSAGAGAGAGGLSFDVSSGALVVGTNATFNGNVFFYKLVTFVQKTVFNDDVTFGGHILTSGTVPTVTLEPAAGITVAPPVDPNNPVPAPNLAKDTITGNDNSGQLNITFGDNSTAGDVLTVNFNKAFDAAPNIFLSPTNQAAAGLRYYITSTPTGFKITLIDPPATTTNMTFGYWVVQ